MNCWLGAKGLFKQVIALLLTWCIGNMILGHTTKTNVLMPRELNTQQVAKAYLRLGRLLESSTLERAELYPPSSEAAAVGTLWLWSRVEEWRSVSKRELEWEEGQEEHGARKGATKIHNRHSLFQNLFWTGASLTSPCISIALPSPLHCPLVKFYPHPLMNYIHGTGATQLQEGKIKTYKQEKWWEPIGIDQSAGSGILPWKISWVIIA